MSRRWALTRLAHWRNVRGAPSAAAADALSPAAAALQARLDRRVGVLGVVEWTRDDDDAMARELGGAVDTLPEAALLGAPADASCAEWRALLQH